MDKSTVISLLQDDKQEKRAKFAVLLMALNQAKNKNLALLSFYNRSGFSEKNLKAIEYDLKKAYGITTSDMNIKKKEAVEETEDSAENETSENETEEAQEEDSETGELILEKLNNQLRETDLDKASYADLKSLAHDLANQLNFEFENQKKATYLAFLDDQKKSLVSES